MLIAILEDGAFRRKMHAIYNRRWTVRALAYNDEGKIAFLHVQGSDVFGRRNHLETIGGGVENDESLEEALRREIKEETGYDCDIIEEVGVIVDHYNLINVENIETYFVVKLKDKGECDPTAKEKELIKDIVCLKEDEALYWLKNCPRRTVNELVQRRDYYALKHYMKNRKKCAL